MAMTLGAGVMGHTVTIHSVNIVIRIQRITTGENQGTQRDGTLSELLKTRKLALSHGHATAKLIQ